MTEESVLLNKKRKTKSRPLTDEEVVECLGLEALPNDGQKRYRVVLPDPQNSKAERIALEDFFSDGEIRLTTANEEQINVFASFCLTEKEIKKHHAYLWPIAKPI